jgi:hypothetical protein
VYEDPNRPAGSSHPPQGQRCAACGQFEADPWARFCGVCGGPLAAAAAGRGSGSGPAPTVYPPAGGPGYQPPQPMHAPAPVAPYARGPIAQDEPIIYTIPSVGFSGPARIGAAVSAAFMLLPCVLFAFGVIWLIHWARDLMDSWRSAQISVPAVVTTVNVNINFLDLMRLHAVHDKLVYWDEHLWLAFALLWLVPWVAWIIAGVLFAVLMALIYNLIGKMGGGMRVTLRPSTTRAGGPPAGNWQQPPQNWPPAPR